MIFSPGDSPGENNGFFFLRGRWFLNETFKGFNNVLSYPLEIHILIFVGCL